MTTTTDIGELLHSAKLEEAIAQLNHDVRTNPTSVDRRAALAELLCISGNLERADTILDAVTDLDPGTAVGVALFRQLVRAEQARQQFFSDGRLPEFLTKPDELLQLELRAAVALREGDGREAAARLRERDAARPAASGVADRVAFDEFRDLDDLSVAHLEVLTSTGKYFWVPLSSVVQIDLRQPERRRDLIWRRAHLSLTEGPDGEVFLPAIYAAADSTPAQRLGHETSFAGESGGPTLGRGLRTFLVGEGSKTIHELGRVEFERPAAEQPRQA
jgi:type VI secretion system protein ImpE